VLANADALTDNGAELFVSRFQALRFSCIGFSWKSRQRRKPATRSQILAKSRRCRAGTHEVVGGEMP